MNYAAFSKPLDLNRRDDVRRVREVFEKADYQEESILLKLAAKSFNDVATLEPPYLDWKTRDRDPLSVLIRVFACNRPTTAAEFAEAVHPTPTEIWTGLGLVTIDGDDVKRGPQIMPYQGRYLLSDLAMATGTMVAADYVMGVSASTTNLANHMVRRPSRRTLDVGTGGGFQALAATPYSDYVVGTDINPRALNFAAFMAQLNDVDSKVEFRMGSFFEPVEGEKFDYIVSNPPFVISPETTLMFTQGGSELKSAGGPDAVSAYVAREAGKRLEEGGFCQMLTNWAIVEGEDWKQRLDTWFEGTDCDAWVLRDDVLPTDRYASTWLTPMHQADPVLFQRRYQEWMEYFEAHRIVSIGFGLVTLRKRSGAASHQRWFDNAATHRIGVVGYDASRQFELFDFLEALPDDRALLNHAFRLSPHVRIVQEMRPVADGLVPSTPFLIRQRGMGYRGDLDGTMVAFLSHCRAGRTLDEIIGALAPELGIERETLEGPILEIAAQMVQRGFLWPAELRDYDIPAHIFDVQKQPGWPPAASVGAE